jgi:hypothetical protein
VESIFIARSLTFDYLDLDSGKVFRGQIGLPTGNRSALRFVRLYPRC